MNIWDHCRLSKRKFGGIEEDYFEIHKFIDSSKMYCFNPKHRSLLHNLYGIELAILKFGDVLTTSDQSKILIREIVAEHCKEDLSGKVPSLEDWFCKYEIQLEVGSIISKLNDNRLEEFLLKPLLRSNISSSLIITFSNFGVYLVNELIGFQEAKKLQNLLPENASIQKYLGKFSFYAQWQFTPNISDLKWLKMDNSTKN